MLEPHDFALSSNELDPPPTDLIDEKTWHHLTNLTDYVAIVTTSYFGSFINKITEVSNEWLLLIKANNLKRPNLALTMLPAHEELDAAIFNLLHGYYKQAFECLRSFLELTVVGVGLEIYNDKVLAEQWACGDREIKCGEACDKLQHHPSLLPFEIYLTQGSSDNFFENKDKILNPNNKRGWVRRLFSSLSKFPHPNLGYANGDLWNSNGPIFSHEAFLWFIECYHETLFLSMLLVKLVKKEMIMSPLMEDHANSETIKNIPVAMSAINYLFYATTA